MKESLMNPTTTASRTLGSFVEETTRSRADHLRRTLSPLVEAFRRRQELDGRIEQPQESDAVLLREIVDVAVVFLTGIGRDQQAHALREDVDAWVEAGLDAKPGFDRSRDAFTVVPNNAGKFFLGAVYTTNSEQPCGHRLDYFYAQRHEPTFVTSIAEAYPHPHNVVQEVILLAGSEGFTRGNCLVFFPENVSAAEKIKEQNYAVFFFSKFKAIHEGIGVAAAREVMTPESVILDSDGMDPYACYEARSLWGYLHDRAHFSGKWPISDYTLLKMNWFIGVLEELKVDAKAILLAHSTSMPYADELLAMILVERLFRYPLEKEAESNFDAATGVFLYSWLHATGAITVSDDRLHIGRKAVLEHLPRLVAEIEAVENGAHTPDEYKASAKSFVYKYLAPAETGRRYRFLPYQEILRSKSSHLADQAPLDFSDPVL
jgi:hypothetical protein